MEDVTGGLLDLLIPERCVACGQGESLLCEACRAALVVLRGPLCDRCGLPTAWPVARCADCTGRRLAFRRARSAVAYEAQARRLVSGWKEQGLRRLTGEIAELVAGAVPAPTVDAITFVPGEPARSLWRGQNAAEALAAALAARWGLPVVPLLARTRAVPRQRGLARRQRRENVRGVFRARGLVPAGVGLVDDVFTTGATVGAAARELRRGGAVAVDVVTFARALRR